MGLGYTDPTPATPDLEPMPARLRITTPEGTSAFINFNVLPYNPAQFSRTLSLPYLSLTTAIQYANQNPAPSGDVYNQVTCDVSVLCAGNWVLGPQCEVLFPPSYVPITGLSTILWVGGGVSPPGGELSSTYTCPGDPCQTVPLTCDAVNPQLSSHWVGTPPEDISDTITIDETDKPGGGTVNLSDLTASGAVLSGPLVSVYLHPSTPAWHVQGGRAGD